MLQMVYYTIAAIILYVVSDWILVQLEKWRGKPFASRNIAFFIIIMVLSVGAFEIVQRVVGTEGDGPAQEAVQEKPEPELIPSPALNRGE